MKKNLGLPIDYQRPSFQKVPLENDKSTLRDNKICHGDTIDLEPMEVQVKTSDGRTANLTVDPEDTVGDIQEQIESVLGVPREDQRPTFQDSPLDSDKTTLRDNNIHHGDVINLSPMEIHVKTPTGRTTTLPVDPNNTIESIKKRVEKNLGIPTDDQRPTFQKQPLLDDSTLKDIGIRHGDTISLEPMEISVRAPDGRTATLRVDPTSTIDDVKEHVQFKLGIPKENQRPTFKKARLDKDSTLRDNNIKHGDVIELEPMKIQVKAPDGRVVDLAVTPSDTIEDIKERVEDDLGIPTDEQRPAFKNRSLPDNSTLKDNDIKHGDVIELEPMEIQVKAPDGRVIDLPVTPDDTIKDIKKRVKENLGIPVEYQRPSFNNDPLDDNSTLKEIGIRHRDTIDLDPMEIKVKSFDKRIAKLAVTPDDAIEYIKQRIVEDLGIPIEDQRPEFKSRPLSDGTSLKANNIHHGDVIDLAPMEVIIKTYDDRRAPIVVQPDFTVERLKEEIQFTLGIHVADQRPTFKDTPLEDTTTLRENSIKHLDVIHLLPIEIQVKAPNGRVVDLVVNPFDTIKDVKKQVKKNLGIPTDYQRPTFNENPLSSKTTLKENDIHHGDVIELQPVEIYVVDLDGNKHTYEVEYSDDIGSIKSRVEADTGIKKRSQRLVFDGDLLEVNKKTLKSLGIKHQDTLNLEPWRVHVQLPEGDKVTLEVDPGTTTPHDLKVKATGGFVPSNHTLEKNGVPLADALTLTQNGLVHDDTVELEIPPPPLKLVAPEINKDWKKAKEPEPIDKYGLVKMAKCKINYDVDFGESMIDGEVEREETEFKLSKLKLSRD